MAALETIRTKFGIGASLIIAFGLLLFLVNPSDIIQTVQSTSSKNDVGKINGKAISYLQFDSETRQLDEVRKMITGTSSTSDEDQTNLRNMTWQSLVDRYLVVPTIESAGIRVGQQEQENMFVGDNPSPIASSFYGFYDEDGNYSVDRVRELVEGAETSETYRMIRDYLFDAARTNRFNEKYISLFNAGTYVNALERKRAIEENNATANVSFVMSPNMYYPEDSTVVVSKADVEKFYNDHKESFRQLANRDIRYAVFELNASQQDIANSNDKFVGLYDDFASTDNMRNFLQKNSDRKWDDAWYKAGELRSVNSDIDTFVSENNAGVSPVYQSGTTFYAARIMDSANIPDSVYVRHIMLVGNDAKHLADSLVNVVNKNNFSTLANLYSADKGNAQDGEMGNIGWMSKNIMIKGFEPVLEAKVGVPFVLNTQYGSHVVEVTKTTKPVAKKKVAIFEKETTISKETERAISEQARLLAVRSQGKLDNFKTICDTTGIYARSLNITEATENYGAISHAKEVTRWAFNNKPGKASDVIPVDNKYYFVVAVEKAHKEGIASLNEVYSDIRSQVYREKYAQKHAADVAAQVEGLSSLEAIAEKLNATVSNLSDVTFSTTSAPTTEPAFVGAVASAKEGAITGPVAGIMGTYVFQVNGRDMGSYFTEDDAKAAQTRFVNYYDQMLMAVMADKAVKDNRARFY
ncbi:MAG: SurA N-terminal domain-containing protein [Bacteroidales bacterium]|nr:SurA N-terminal domain-containing protein [Bacteroidales bacterium]